MNTKKASVKCFVIVLFQETQNVLYFMDESSGSWLPMPLNWERHVPNISSLIDKVQVKHSLLLDAHVSKCAVNVRTYASHYVAISGIYSHMYITTHVPNLQCNQRMCPHWKDVKSIVSLLRQCNYNVEDCISTYLSLNDDGRSSIAASTKRTLSECCVLSGVLDCAEGSGRDILRAKTEQKLSETVR